MGIMRLSEGALTIESAGEGQGTTVTLTLPRAPATAELTT
jgi:signal transduction histidine kinase